MIDPVDSAKAAGLIYVTDSQTGIRRKRKGKGFTYVHDSRGTVKDESTLQRIKDLVIPPAWEDVWICNSPNGHLQVTGRDVKGRKQYRYHEKWNERRNETKFEQMLSFAEKIPLLKSHVEEDLKLPGLPREKVLAAVIKIMLITQSRVGNSTYAEENETYGLTTILNDHAEVKGSKIHLSFNGKSGVEHDIAFADPLLAKIIKRCQDLPGEELFGYINDNNEAVDINSTHVNDYLKSVTGEDFTAKDLRTWGGTVKALEIICQNSPEDELSETKWKKRHVFIIKETASHLRNTVAVCRKYYIHPVIFEADKNGKILQCLKSRIRSNSKYSREEMLFLTLLKAA